MLQRRYRKPSRCRRYFDKFHVVSLVNNAVEQVRRIEGKSHPELSGTRYVWLKNPQNLTEKQQNQLDTFDLVGCHLKNARAYQIRLAFQDLFTQPAEQAEYYLNRWYLWATPDATRPESSAGSLPEVKACGYRSDRNLTTINLTTIIYLIAGKLDLPGLPT